MIDPAMIDPDVQAFIELTASYYPAGVVDLDVAGQRKAYDRMCADFRGPRPPGVSTTDESLPGSRAPIPARRYVFAGDPGAALVLYFHGGGYVLGGLESHDDVCAEICAATGCAVLSVAYRLAPEHVHPAQFDDAMSAYHVARNQAGPIIVAGDSAGGNLAAAMSIALRGGPSEPIGQVLIYPALGGETLDLPSYRENAEAPMLNLREMFAYNRARAGGPPPHDDPTFSPLAAADFAALPPCFAASAGIDPLRDDAEFYVERLNAAGSFAQWRNEPGLPHGFLRARFASAKAKASFDAVCEAIRRIAANEFAS